MNPPYNSPPSKGSSGDAAYQRHSHIFVRDGKPESVVISYASYLRLQEAQASGILAQFDRLLARLGEQNAAYSEDEVAADVEMARGS